MKFSENLLVLALALRASSSPTPVDVNILEIPIEHIVSGNLSAYTEHAQFSKYTAWAAQSSLISSIVGDAKAATEHSTLKAISCDDTNDSCFYVSSIHIPELASRDQTPASLFKRSDASSLVVATHWKTYYRSQEGGHEHYTTWNLKCARLDYRSTGFALDPSRKATRNFHSANGLITDVYVRETNYLPHKLQLHEVYGCSFFGNKCCDTTHWVGNVGSGDMYKWTWECTSATSASACQG